MECWYSETAALCVCLSSLFAPAPLIVALMSRLDLEPANQLPLQHLFATQAASLCAARLFA
jgi:hypothetical protein